MATGPFKLDEYKKRMDGALTALTRLARIPAHAPNGGPGRCSGSGLTQRPVQRFFDHIGGALFVLQWTENPWHRSDRTALFGGRQVMDRHREGLACFFDAVERQQDADLRAHRFERLGMGCTPGQRGRQCGHAGEQREIWAVDHAQLFGAGHRVHEFLLGLW